MRLIGIGVSNLESGEQLELFIDREAQDHTDRLIDMMKQRYGEKITRGAFLRRPPDPAPERDSRNSPSF